MRVALFTQTHNVSIDAVKVAGILSAHFEETVAVDRVKIIDIEAYSITTYVVYFTYRGESMSMRLSFCNDYINVLKIESEQ